MDRQQEQIQNIIRQLISRDERGIDMLLLHYGPLMRYIIAPILPNPQDQEECLSEAVTRIWYKIALFNPECGSWNAWLTALTRNVALNHLRKSQAGQSKQQAGDMAEEAMKHIPSPDPSPEEIVLQKEQKEALSRALNQLSSGERTLFYRKYYYLQTTAQISRELGMTERAVEGRLYRLKKKLRKILGGE